jgi:DNA-binding transcriptional regulator YiaG
MGDLVYLADYQAARITDAEIEARLTAVLARQSVARRAASAAVVTQTLPLLTATVADMKARDLELMLISEARAAGDGRGRRLREALRLTQDEVARAISSPRYSVSRSAVAMYESDTRKPRGRRALEYGKLLRMLEEQIGSAADAEREPAG